MTAQKPVFKRVLLKLSGEALLGKQAYGIDPEVLKRLAREVREVAELGTEVAIVVGGGNIFRGVGLADGGMERATGDQMGMLATVMNALALQDALEGDGLFARVMSAIRINQVCEDYIRRRAIRHLQKGRIVIFAAGTGNPFFTTDSAASLRSVEIGAELMLKATKVDGVYDADPATHDGARHFSHLTYDEVLDWRLNVMDQTAVVMCRDYSMSLRVFDVTQPGGLMRIVQGARDIGTLVDNGDGQ